MKNVLFYVSILMLIFLTSCDPQLSYQKVIENNSDYDLFIKVYPNSYKSGLYLLKKDSFIVYKNTFKVLINDTTIGYPKKYEGCNTYCDSIVVKILDNDSLRLNIDIAKNEHWQFSILDNTSKGGRTCECRLNISNDMIK